MLTNIYAIYDSKAEAYMQPMFMPTKGLAIRAFSAAVNDPKHQFSKYAEDYTLFELGSYNDQNAEFIMKETPVSIGVAIEFLNKQTEIQGAAEMNDLMGERKKSKKREQPLTNILQN